MAWIERGQIDNKQKLQFTRKSLKQKYIKMLYCDHVPNEKKISIVKNILNMHTHNALDKNTILVIAEWYEAYPVKRQ